MSLRRITRHAFTPPWSVKRAFPPASLAAIGQAVTRSEQSHSGQVRFAVERTLHGPRLYHGLSPRERALEVFSGLRMWDTTQRNGVLIYLLLADRAVEIVVDRAAAAQVKPAQWQAICRDIEARLACGEFERAIIGGIADVTAVMAAHFPPTGAPSHELPDEPVVL